MFMTLTYLSKVAKLPQTGTQRDGAEDNDRQPWCPDTTQEHCVPPVTALCLQCRP